MDFDPSLFIKPVAGEPDTFAFQYGFALAPEGKAAEDTAVLDTDSVVELDDGDLLIEGWAANFEGLDRQNENFTDGAFKRGIKSFLANGGPLCFHHKFDHNIGRVLELEEVEGKGLRMRARVDKQEPTSPLHYIYNGIKKGSIRGLSVGGFFKRKLTEAGYRIADMDFTEISVTPVAVHPKTSFAVVAGKALEAPEEKEDEKPEEPEAPDAALVELNSAIEALSSLADSLEGKALPAKHKPGVARDLKTLLDQLGTLRSTATGLRAYGDAVKEIEEDTKQEETLGAFADQVESQCVNWEAEVHRLAARFGPLPPPVNDSEL